MDDQYQTHLGPLIEGLLHECVKHLGFKLPLTVVAVSSNGSLIAMQVDGHGSESTIVARHCVTGKFALPINLLVSDALGEACRCVLKADGRTPLY